MSTDDPGNKIDRISRERIKRQIEEFYVSKDIPINILERGTAAWNWWRRQNPEARIDLSGANLSGAKLGAMRYSLSDISRANLSGVDLSGAKPQSGWRRSP